MLVDLTPEEMDLILRRTHKICMDETAMHLRHKMAFAIHECHMEVVRQYGQAKRLKYAQETAAPNPD